MPDSIKAALRTLFLARYDQFRRHLHKRLGSEDLANDALHETYLRMEGMNVRAAIRFPSAYLFRIALNVAISFVRSRRRRPTVPLNEGLDGVAEASAAGVESDERIRELYRFIDQLDRLDRALLLLYLEAHSYREIAEILGITETNVATKISRLKLRMTHEMNPAPAEARKRHGS